MQLQIKLKYKNTIDAEGLKCFPASFFWPFLAKYLERNKKMPNFAVTNPGGYQSGQMGQTVNLLAYAFGGSNPSLPTQNIDCGSSSVGRALAFQAKGREFEPRLPLQSIAYVAQG